MIPDAATLPLWLAVACALAALLLWGAKVTYAQYIDSVWKRMNHLQRSRYRRIEARLLILRTIALTIGSALAVIVIVIVLLTLDVPRG